MKKIIFIVIACLFLSSVAVIAGNNSKVINERPSLTQQEWQEDTARIKFKVKNDSIEDYIIELKMTDRGKELLPLIVDGETVDSLYVEKGKEVTAEVEIGIGEKKTTIWDLDFKAKPVKGLVHNTKFVEKIFDFKCYGATLKDPYTRYCYMSPKNNKTESKLKIDSRIIEFNEDFKPSKALDKYTIDIKTEFPFTYIDETGKGNLEVYAQKFHEVYGVRDNDTMTINLSTKDNPEIIIIRESAGSLI